MSQPRCIIIVVTSRKHSRFRCTECGQVATVWNGRCPGCSRWNTFTEERVGPDRTDRAGSTPDTVIWPLDDVSATAARPVSVGVAEVDRVLSGGLVPGSVTLLAGPPGIGKSTLAIQMAIGTVLHGGDAPVLYVTAEETVAQIRLRAERVGRAIPRRLWVTDATSVEVVCDLVAAHRPALMVVDSIQSLVDDQVASIAGSVSQVRNGAQRLAEVARSVGTSLVLVGHVTKDGSVAGPKSLEHLVDTVLGFDADPQGRVRFLRASKHRHGPVGELGVFTMESDGLREVRDVAGMFLGDRRGAVPGSAVTPVLEGARGLVVEIQALVEANGSGTVKVCQGVRRGRVDLVRAVLDRRLGVSGDVFCSAVGGLVVSEPAADLAIAVALVSAAVGVPVAASTVVFGEVGLTGEVRGVCQADRRLAEAARLDFSRAIVPASVQADVSAPGMELCRVGGVDEAIEAALESSTTSLLLPRRGVGVIGEAGTMVG